MNSIIIKGTLIDGTSAAPRPNRGIVIADSKIVDLPSRHIHSISDVNISKEAEVIDATGHIIMPGLIDAHLHLLGIRSMEPVQWTLDKAPLRAARATADAQKLIEAGFTSVRCAGSDVSVHLNRPLMKGPYQVRELSLRIK
jgi:imidazolonepropionase-like amidohydrolase